MDPITLSAVAALAAAAAGVGSGFLNAVGEDAYKRLKGLVAHRFTGAEPALLAVEAAPAQEAPRQALASALDTAGAGRDEAFREEVQRLLAALLALRTAPTPPPILDFDELEAAQRFEMRDITATGTVLKVRGKATFNGDVVFSNIRQGGISEKH